MAKGSSSTCRQRYTFNYKFRHRVASASDTRNSIVLAALAGLAAGALSMAAGEYVSVRSQSDLDTSD